MRICNPDIHVSLMFWVSSSTHRRQENDVNIPAELLTANAALTENLKKQGNNNSNNNSTTSAADQKQTTSSSTAAKTSSTSTTDSVKQHHLNRFRVS